MKQIDEVNIAEMRAQSRAQHAWRARSDAAIAEFLRLAGAKHATTPIEPFSERLYTSVYLLMDHWFCGRTQYGIFIVSELWRDVWTNGGYWPIARNLIKVGFKISVLPTKFSTREVGRRRPTVIVPPWSDVDPRTIHDKLVAADFKGAPALDEPKMHNRTPPAAPT